MKIIFYLESIGNGGVGRVTVNLCNEFVDRGHIVYLITNTNGNKFEINPKVHIIERPLGASRISEVLFLRNIFKEITPDVVVGMINFFLWAFLASIGKKIPVIASDHASFEYQPNLASKIFRFYIYRLADAVTILTNRDREVLGKRLPKKNVIANPIRIPSKLTPIELRKKTIIAAGRLDDWYVKGFDLIINGWSEIAAKFPEWKLVIAGGGHKDSLEKLNKMALDKKIPSTQIEFCGFTSNMEELLNNSRLFVLSSRTEGMPMVLLEAMASGCSCIATSCNGRAEEILNDAGLVVKPDAESLAKAIDSVITNQLMQKKFSEKSIIKSQYYSADVIAKRWEELFTKVINKN